MDKLKMQTPNLIDKNIEQIAKLFPSVITEAKDEEGNSKKAIDFDLLKQSLSDVLIDDEDERYRLDWPGKKASLLKANTPISKTLRPCREESLNFDTTENIYIEGDNFEVLKILQESYLGRIKMIYIDPPYNTGSDFIYKDDFKVSKDEYEEEIGAVDEEGDKLFKNTDSNGRFHSDWLSMMYERLVVAKDLLKDDGVIFISIDDNEQVNLKKICDEIFGEENFVADIVVVNNFKGRNDKRYIATAHERLLMYVKTDIYEENGLKLPEDRIGEYKKKDDIGSYRNLGLRKRGGADTKEQRPNMFFPIYINEKTNEVSLEKDDAFQIEIYPRKSDGTDGCWRWGDSTVRKRIKSLEGLPVNNAVGWDVFEKDYLETNGEIRKIKPKSVMLGSNYSTDGATKSFRLLMEGAVFNSPKSVVFLSDLIFYATFSNNNDLILDFFSGSATTAHAVMHLNAEDNGNRKFIMVQLPEKTEEESDAFKAGYKTITEIAKERIRRAGKKIKKELEEKNKQLKLGEEPIDTANLDIGFRVYKTDSTNMKDVYYHPEELQHKQLSFLESNIKEDRTPDDLLTQVILDLGLELNLPIEKKEILGNTVFIVQTNALVACFDDNINFKIVDEIADLKPFKVVFKDASFADDKDRINVEERFKRLSPETVITVI